ARAADGVRTRVDADPGVAARRGTGHVPGAGRTVRRSRLLGRGPFVLLMIVTVIGKEGDDCHSTANARRRSGQHRRRPPDAAPPGPAVGERPMRQQQAAPPAVPRGRPWLAAAGAALGVGALGPGGGPPPGAAPAAPPLAGGALVPPPLSSRRPASRRV